MTSMTTRLQQRLDARTPSPAPLLPPNTARRILLVGTLVSALTLIVAIVGLLVDQTLIGGAPAWLKPAKFGVSITLYLATLSWILGAIRGHRRLLTALSIVLVTAFALETLWIDVQVVRGTTSHFNQSTTGDGLAFDAAGAVVSLIFLATVGIAILALRTPGLDIGIGAGIRWGLVVALVGMLEAIAMLVNGTTDTTSGAHSVGGPDGGPGMLFTGWSLDHGDLRVAHFFGIHGLQLLPLLAFLLLRVSRLRPETRRDLVRVAGVAAIVLTAMLWWQAERGQPLLQPDLVTLAGVAALALATGAAGIVIARRDDDSREAVLHRV